jgi:hypothetical protein
MDTMRKMEASLAMVSLNNKGVDLLHVEYSGGGDSGAIDSVEAYKNVRIICDENQDPMEIQGEMSSDNHMHPMDMEMEQWVDIIKHEFIYPILNEIEDWWNNEGGYGIMHIDLNSGTYMIENNIYGEAEWDEETDEYDYDNQEVYSYGRTGQL